MSVKHFLVAISLASVGACLVGTPVAVAQTPATAETPPAPPVKTFKLLHESPNAARNLDVEDVEAQKWVPGIHAGTKELSLSLGFMGLTSTLLQREQMIYKYNTEATYWGDIKITGQSAFNPVLRLGYTLKPWLTLEGFGGLSISEYTSSIENAHWRKNEPNAQRQDNPVIGQYDAEARSLITLQAGADAMIYPLNFKGDGAGRLHPYFTAQVGRIWYDMNSDYTAGSTAANDMGFGGGVRLLAEKNISLRLEATYHFNKVEFAPAEYFLETNQGTTLVPLMEFPNLPDGGFTERRITSFEAQDVNYLAWTLGVQGSF